MPGTIKTAAYRPSPVPGQADALPSYLASELERIAGAVSLLAAGHIEVSYRAPDKPRDGDIRLADGLAWNPGLGVGVYAWYGGSWNKLG